MGKNSGYINNRLVGNLLFYSQITIGQAHSILHKHIGFHAKLLFRQGLAFIRNPASFM